MFRFIRKVLAEGGAPHIQIISKIESWHGVINYDDILKESGEETQGTVKVLSYLM
jgi:pyruvate kinase